MWLTLGHFAHFVMATKKNIYLAIHGVLSPSYALEDQIPIQSVSNYASEHI
jgi:hypothetical protein